MPKPKPERRISALSEIAARETENYLRDRERMFLEAAIGLLLHSHSISEVTKMLRDHADHLEQFG